MIILQIMDIKNLILSINWKESACLYSQVIWTSHSCTCLLIYLKLIIHDYCAYNFFKNRFLFESASRGVNREVNTRRSITQKIATFPFPASLVALPSPLSVYHFLIDSNLEVFIYCTVEQAIIRIAPFPHRKQIRFLSFKRI